MSHQRKVYVVGRDLEARRSLTHHVSAIGAEAWPFSGGEDFLEILDHLAPACVLLDVDMVDVTGIDVLREMADRELGWPVVAISAREDLHVAVEAMKLGALDFLHLPVTRERLAIALEPAWKRLDKVVEAGESRRAAQELLVRLTAREMDVLLALLGGLSNKKVAHEFGISVRTVEMHRAHIMTKLGVKSLAEAALLAPQAGIDLAASGLPAGKHRGPAFAGCFGADCREQLAALARRLAT